MNVGVLGSLIRHFVQSLEVGLLIVMSNEEADRRANKSRGSRDERRARERDLPRTVAPTYLDGQRVGKVWVTLVVVEMKQRGPRCVRDEVSWVLSQGQGQGIHTSCSAWRWDDSAVDAS